MTVKFSRKCSNLMRKWGEIPNPDLLVSDEDRWEERRKSSKIKKQKPDKRSCLLILLVLFLIVLGVYLFFTSMGVELGETRLPLTGFLLIFVPFLMRFLSGLCWVAGGYIMIRFELYYRSQDPTLARFYILLGIINVCRFDSTPHQGTLESNLICDIGIKINPQTPAPSPPILHPHAQCGNRGVHRDAAPGSGTTHSRKCPDSQHPALP